MLALRGFSAVEVGSAQEFIRAKFAAPASGDWARYDELAAAHRGARWFGEVGGAPAHDHPAHEFLRQNGRFDPVPLLTEVKLPVLWLNAQFDESSPAEKTMADLAAAHRPNIAPIMIPGADHGMMTASAPHLTDEALPAANGFAPAFLPTLREWLRNLK